MTLYAVDDLDDALEATRGLLTPVERGTWLKLALVALFVGGPAANGLSWTAGGNGATAPPGETPSVDLGPEIWAIVAAVVAAVVLFGLAVLLLGSILEFVFVESLRHESVEVSRYWGRRWRQGLRLFGFRLVLGLFVVAGLVVVAVSVVLPLVGVDAVGGGLAVLTGLLTVPLFLVLAILVGIVYSFTTVFVVPVMIQEDAGVVAGWRRLWPTITAHWRQYLAYVVVVFVLNVVAGIAVGVATALGAVLLAVPFALLAAVAAGLFFFVAEPLGIIAFAVLAVLFVLALVLLAALVQLPVKTYFRYYGLLVLGDVDADLDLIPDRRAAIREATAPEDG